MGTPLLCPPSPHAADGLYYDFFYDPDSYGLLYDSALLLVLGTGDRLHAACVQANTYMDLMDKNNDGQVSAEEWIEFWASTAGGGAQLDRLISHLCKSTGTVLDQSLIGSPQDVQKVVVSPLSPRRVKPGMRRV